MEDQEHENYSLLTNLCRICGCEGTFSIHSEPPDYLLCIKPNNASKNKIITIANMISLISGKDVDKNDKLPQLICKHCLQYLQHAYNVRNQVIETEKKHKIMLDVLFWDE